MIKWILHWFHREPRTPIGWALQMKILMYRHRYLRLVKDDNLFKVNQELTSLLLEDEKVFVRQCPDQEESFMKRHQLVAQQLEELLTLRQEIKEVYQDLDRDSK